MCLPHPPQEDGETEVRWAWGCPTHLGRCTQPGLTAGLVHFAFQCLGCYSSPCHQHCGSSPGTEASLWNHSCCCFSESGMAAPLLRTKWGFEGGGLEQHPHFLLVKGGVVTQWNSLCFPQKVQFSASPLQESLERGGRGFISHLSRKVSE